MKRVCLHTLRRWVPNQQAFAIKFSRRSLSSTTKESSEISPHPDIKKPSVNNHNTFASLWNESWKDVEPDVVIHGKRVGETQSWLQIFHEPITRLREINWSLPWNIGQIHVPFTLSNVAGHGSFLFLMASYLETDFLHLRMYAFSGISLSLIFQYYREKPLWIPLQWNFLFLLINAVMISFLWKESNDAEDMMKNEEQKHLYDSTFKIYAMKPVDFLHLMSIAQRREVAIGEKLVEQGKHHNHLHLVQSGRFSVKRDRMLTGEIHAHQFAGAMSFLTWEGEYELRQRMQREQDEELNVWRSSVADVEGTGGDIDVLNHILTSMGEYLHLGEYFIRARIGLGIAGLGSWLDLLLWGSDKETEEDYDTVMTPWGVSPIRAFRMVMLLLGFDRKNRSVEGKNDGGNCRGASIVENNDNNHHHNITTIITTNNSTSNNNNKNAIDGSAKNTTHKHHLSGKGYADVTCEGIPSNSLSGGSVHNTHDSHNGCVVYSWKFRQLHEMMIVEPRISQIVDEFLSKDMNKKMAATWQLTMEPRAKYRTLVKDALCEYHHTKYHAVSTTTTAISTTATTTNKPTSSTSSSSSSTTNKSPSPSSSPSSSSKSHPTVMKVVEVTRKEKRMLQRFRSEHQITDKEHEQIVQELGWTMKEYELGMKNILPVETTEVRQGEEHGELTAGAMYMSDEYSSVEDQVQYDTVWSPLLNLLWLGGTNTNTGANNNNTMTDSNSNSHAPNKK